MMVDKIEDLVDYTEGLDPVTAGELIQAARMLLGACETAKQGMALEETMNLAIREGRRVLDGDEGDDTDNYEMGCRCVQCLERHGRPEGVSSNDD